MDRKEEALSPFHPLIRTAGFQKAYTRGIAFERLLGERVDLKDGDGHGRLLCSLFGGKDSTKRFARGREFFMMGS